MDTDRQADEAWILGVQRRLYQWSKAHPDEGWRDMWGWLTDLRTLRHAWQRVASNKGGRTAGIDGMTVGRIRKRGEGRFLKELQVELRCGAYRPSPARRKLIPKAGKPGQFRPLGIPTVKDRVVQGAIKILLEPIFEAQFWRVSYGFRPGRSTAPWRISGRRSSRASGTRMVTGPGCHIHGSSRATSRAASTISTTTI